MSCNFTSSTFLFILPPSIHSFILAFLSTYTHPPTCSAILHPPKHYGTLRPPILAPSPNHSLLITLNNIPTVVILNILVEELLWRFNFLDKQCHSYYINVIKSVIYDPNVLLSIRLWGECIVLYNRYVNYDKKFLKVFSVTTYPANSDPCIKWGGEKKKKVNIYIFKQTHEKTHMQCTAFNLRKSFSWAIFYYKWSLCPVLLWARVFTNLYRWTNLYKFKRCLPNSTSKENMFWKPLTRWL